MFLIIVILVLALAGLGYAFRVPLLAKILGQPQDRIRRQLERRR
jgi:hypothetical protein